MRSRLEYLEKRIIKYFVYLKRSNKHELNKHGNQALIDQMRKYLLRAKNDKKNSFYFSVILFLIFGIFAFYAFLISGQYLRGCVFTLISIAIIIRYFYYIIPDVDFAQMKFRLDSLADKPELNKLIEEDIINYLKGISEGNSSDEMYHLREYQKIKEEKNEGSKKEIDKFSHVPTRALLLYYIMENELHFKTLNDEEFSILTSCLFNIGISEMNSKFKRRCNIISNKNKTKYTSQEFIKETRTCLAELVAISERIYERLKKDQANFNNTYNV